MRTQSSNGNLSSSFSAQSWSSPSVLHRGRVSQPCQSYDKSEDKGFVTPPLNTIEGCRGNHMVVFRRSVSSSGWVACVIRTAENIRPSTSGGRRCASSSLDPSRQLVLISQGVGLRRALIERINTTKTKDQDARTSNISQEDIQYSRDGASRIPHRDGRDGMLAIRISATNIAAKHDLEWTCDGER